MEILLIVLWALASCCASPSLAYESPHLQGQGAHRTFFRTQGSKRAVAVDAFGDLSEAGEYVTEVRPDHGQRNLSRGEIVRTRRVWRPTLAEQNAVRDDPPDAPAVVSAELCVTGGAAKPADRRLLDLVVSPFIPFDDGESVNASSLVQPIPKSFAGGSPSPRGFLAGSDSVATAGQEGALQFRLMNRSLGGPGRIRLRLRYKDTCNMLEIIYRVFDGAEDADMIVVALKRYAGMTTYAQCGKSGYSFSKQILDVPKMGIGTVRTLRARVRRDLLHLWLYDSREKTVPLPENEVNISGSHYDLNFGGKLGFRADNVAIDMLTLQSRSIGITEFGHWRALGVEPGTATPHDRCK